MFAIYTAIRYAFGMLDTFINVSIFGVIKDYKLINTKGGTPAGVGLTLEVAGGQRKDGNPAPNVLHKCVVWCGLQAQDLHQKLSTASYAALCGILEYRKTEDGKWYTNIVARPENIQSYGPSADWAKVLSDMAAMAHNKPASNAQPQRVHVHAPGHQTQQRLPYAQQEASAGAGTERWAGTGPGAYNSDPRAERWG